MTFKFEGEEMCPIFV